jgi:peptide/nickel transport system substrate-binding protein
MKRLLALGVMLYSNLALAAPFIYPSKWYSQAPQQAKTGGTFRDTAFQDFTGMNPFYVRLDQSIPNRMAAGSFLRLDPVTRDYVPHLAESYTLSADKRSYTYKLRSGMKWSDGKPITADDWMMVYKINTDESMETEYYDGYFIEGKPIIFTKIDAMTLRITLPKAVANGVEQSQFTPQPAHVFGPAYAKGKEALENMWSLSEKPENIVTGGPWTVTSYRPGERVIFARNPYFGEWNKDSAGKPLPYLDGYTVEISRDQNAQLAAFLAGQIDRFEPLNVDMLAQIRRVVDAGNLKATLKANASSSQTGDRIAFNWNYKSNPFKQSLFRNPDFRRAMSHLMNRTAMVQIAVGGTGQPLWSSIPPLFKQFQSPNLKKYEFNLEAAAKLLAKIGFTRKNSEGYLINGQGKVLEFSLSPNAGNGRRAALSNIFKDEAKKVGVKVNVVPLDSGTWAATLGGGDKSDDRKFDALMYGIIGGGIIFPFSDSILGCNGALTSYNQSGKCIEPWETQTQALYNRALSEFDAKKRQQTAWKIQDIESNYQAVVYLIAPNWHVAWSSRSQNEYNAEAIDQYVLERDLETTWINP